MGDVGELGERGAGKGREEGETLAVSPASSRFTTGGYGLLSADAQSFLRSAWAMWAFLIDEALEWGDTEGREGREDGKGSEGREGLERKEGEGVEVGVATHRGPSSSSSLVIPSSLVMPSI